MCSKGKLVDSGVALLNSFWFSKVVDLNNFIELEQGFPDFKRNYFARI